MRTSDADYSNTIIYKISCKDVSITDLYVGHTTDFTKRRKSHRHACDDPKANAKLYTFIREHGGWQNWKIEIVNFFNCSDLTEARQKEQEYFTSLGATLNSIEPFPSANVIVEEQPTVCLETVSGKFNCESCHFTCDKLSEWSRHIARRKHLSAALEKNKEYVCEKCNITFCKLSKWNRHILTTKHLNDNKMSASKKCFACSKCKKEYKSQRSVNYHESRCNHVEIQYVAIIDRLMNDNAELRNFIVEQTKTVSETMNKTIETMNNLLQQKCDKP